MTPDGLLGRAELERAFTALGDRLVRRGVVADVFIVGGAAMALAHERQPRDPRRRRHVFAMRASARARGRDERTTSAPEATVLAGAPDKTVAKRYITREPAGTWA
jgi:hypothetical protein